MESLLVTLILWLSINAGINIDTLPKVEFLKGTEIVHLYGKPALALYAHKAKTIYLDERINLETGQGKSTLLHELVHHYQNISGKMAGYECSHASERLAYEVQRDYLLSEGFELMPQLTPFNIAMKSICTY